MVRRCQRDIEVDGSCHFGLAAPRSRAAGSSLSASRCVDTLRAKLNSEAILRRFAPLGLALLCVACANGPLRDEPRLVFQTVASGDAPLVRIYSDESVVVSLAGEEFWFGAVETTYPRWNGTRYRAQSGERGLFMEVRDDRPCAVDGVDRRRTATVLVSLSGTGADQTTCGYHTTTDETE